MTAARRTTRWILRGIVCALIGAVVTVAVAWGCALWVPVQPRCGADRYSPSDREAKEPPPDGISKEDWRPNKWVLMEMEWRHQVQPKKWKGDPVPTIKRLEAAADREWMRGYESAGFFSRAETVWLDSGIGFSIYELSLGYSGDDMGSATVLEYRAGWPLAACEGGQFQVFPGWQMPPPPQWRMTAEPPRWLRPLPPTRFSRRVPYGVLWPGVILDTVFWGTLAWALIWGRAHAVRALRRRRQHCEACGYDRRGLASEGAACPECGHPGRAVV